MRCFMFVPSTVYLFLSNHLLTYYLLPKYLPALPILSTVLPSYLVTKYPPTPPTPTYPQYLPTYLLPTTQIPTYLTYLLYLTTLLPST